jgi:outer membrane protein assembly factor BamA
MRLTAWVLFVMILARAGFSAHAECINDHRSNKNAGILIIDFTITGTQTISASDLAGITSDMIGSCFDENSEEMEERVRASFQDRGYFKVEVKSLSFKPSDPLGIPKPVTLEGEVSEGARYKLAEITFVKNLAFSSETLRQQFPLRRGALFERGKIAHGLESLRKLYGTHGFLDWTAVPETIFSSNAKANLNISIQEGPQYHMGKLETLGDKELAAQLRAKWNLAEGDVYDNTYIDQFLKLNRDSLPGGFSRANVRTIQNCPDALVEVRLIIDLAEDSSHAEPKNVPCEDHHEVLK